jgi:hypothetical protein
VREAHQGSVAAAAVLRIPQAAAGAPRRPLRLPAPAFAMQSTLLKEVSICSPASPGMQALSQPLLHHHLLRSCTGRVGHTCPSAAAAAAVGSRVAHLQPPAAARWSCLRTCWTPSCCAAPAAAAPGSRCWPPQQRVWAALLAAAGRLKEFLQPGEGSIEHSTAARSAYMISFTHCMQPEAHPMRGS